MWTRSIIVIIAVSLQLWYSTGAEKEWSWGGSKSSSTTEDEAKPDTTAEGGSVSPNVVDEIVTNGRSGKMLSGFNDVYQDQDVRDAIASGNDTHARSLVRERLCGLGLMSVCVYFYNLRVLVQNATNAICMILYPLQSLK